MAEDVNGNLYVNTYSTLGDDFVYRSTDVGATFSVWYNITDEPIDHIHCVGVDRANNDVYIGAGDTNEFIRRWNGSSWSNITTGAESGNLAQPTDIWSDGSHIYFGPDATNPIVRIPSGGSWSEREEVFSTRHLPSSTANWVFEGVYHPDSGMHIVGTMEGQIVLSADGEHWVKAVDHGDTSEVFSISNRPPIYYTDREQHKLYRLDVNPQAIHHLFYMSYLDYRGSVTNAENYLLEQRIPNGTSHIDLTNVVLSNVHASIIGLDRRNAHQDVHNNTGFEAGDYSGWTKKGSPDPTVVTEEAYEGTYSLKEVKSASDPFASIMIFGSHTCAEGDIILASFYTKANTTLTDAIQVSVAEDGTNRYTATFDVSTSWDHHTLHWSVQDGREGDYEIKFGFLQKDCTTYLDATMVIYSQVGISYYGTTEEAYIYTQRYAIPTHFYETQNTTNPSITIGSQVISHSGQLTNGTESTPTTLSGTLSGAVQILANIQGSEQAILKLNGTRMFYEDSVILQGKEGSIFYGRYYGTFSPIVTGDNLILVTKISATLSSVSDAANKSIFTVTSPNGTTTLTKLYCANREEPYAIYAVNGTLTWNYNASAVISTLNTTHGNPTRILIYWKCPADVNDNGMVDISDLARIGKAYGSTPCCSNWNEDCDIDGDETICISDLEICVEHYGIDQ